MPSSYVLDRCEESASAAPRGTTADIDSALREIRRDEPVIDTVEKGLKAAKAAGPRRPLASPHPLTDTLLSMLQEDPFAGSLCASFDELLAPVLLTLDIFAN